MTNEKEFEQMVDQAFKEYEKELKRAKYKISDMEFQKFQSADIKDIEKMLDEGSVNQMEF